MYNSNESGRKEVIPRDDTGPHGGEPPTPGTPLVAGLREADGPHPFGARFGKFINHDLKVLDLLLIVKELCVQHGLPCTTFAWRSLTRLYITYVQ